MTTHITGSSKENVFSMAGRPAEMTGAENEVRKRLDRQKCEADGWNGRKGWNENPSEMGDELARDRDGVSKENEEIQS